eukprot:SM000437S15697  [mRNA]  locus=s437:1942:5633:- [translate_table: standard]
MLRRGEAQMRLHGHVLTRGYYYTNVSIGTPPQSFNLIVDTGSTVTYVPCSTCKHCGNHQDGPFVAANSTTYRTIPCFDKGCSSRGCNSDGMCVYERHYAEQSSSKGLLVTDIVTFSGGTSSIGPARVSFGCETDETGDLYQQKADGIIALGRGPLGIIDQIVAAGLIDDVFSLCYGGMAYDGGTMILGSSEMQPPDMIYTELEAGRSQYYNVKVEELRVDGEALELSANVFDRGYGAVLDSGTTFMYLPKEAFNAFRHAVDGATPLLHRVDGPDAKFNDICYADAGEEVAKLHYYFPQVDLVLGGGVVYKLDPENYLFQHAKQSGAYCLGVFANSDGAGSLLGGILVRNTLVTYDRVNSRIGLWKTDCDDPFASLSASGIKAPNAPPTEAPGMAPMPATADAPTPEAEDGGLMTPSPSPQPQPGPPATDPTSCEGCASRLLVNMTLGMNHSDFGPKSEAFVALLASGLGILAGQRIQDLLINHHVTLDATFGDYRVEDVAFIPLHAGSRSKQAKLTAQQGYAIVAVASFIAIGSLLAAGMIWRARRRQALPSYDSVLELDEMLDGDNDGGEGGGNADQKMLSTSLLKDAAKNEEAATGPLH